MPASLDNQRKTLEEQAKHEGPMGDWARKMLAKLFPPPAAPESPATPPEAPAATDEPPKLEDAVVYRTGAHGNCFDCQAPFDTKAKRTPFRAENADIIHLCRQCADKRWSAINSKL